MLAISTVGNLGRRAAAKLLRMAAAKANETACRFDSHALLTRGEKEILARNRTYCDRYKGRRAFVLGNGPSLNQLHLECLQNELVFAVNGFACHPILDVWQPAVLALGDPSYSEKYESFLAEFEQIRKRLSTCSFFLPLSFWRTFTRHRLLPAERCFYSCLRGNMAFQKRFTVDLTRPVPGGQTVALFAILISLYMGCNPIYLVGMDHDFLATPKAPTHFSDAYEASVAGSEVPRFSTWTYLRLVQAVTRMFEGYVNIKRVADSRGQCILNATPGGFLDVFPRVQYECLF